MKRIPIILSICVLTMVTCTTTTSLFSGKSATKYNQPAVSTGSSKLPPTASKNTVRATITWENGKRPPISLEYADQINLLSMIDGPALGLAWSPDGKMLAISSADATTIYDATTYAEIRSIKTISAGSYKPLSFSPDGSLLAYENGLDTVIWNLLTNESVATLQYRSNPLFSPDGKTLAVEDTGTESGKYSILFYDTSDFSAEPRALVGWEDVFVESMGFNPDGNRLVTLYRDHSIRIWDVNSKGVLVSGQTDYSYAMAWSPTGNLIAASGFNGVQFLDPSNLQVLYTEPQIPAEMSGGMAFSPDGDILAIPDSFGQFDLIDTAGKHSPSRFDVPKIKETFENVTGIAFHPDGTLLALGTCNSGGGGGYGAVWIYGIGTPLATPSPLPSNTPEPTNTSTPTVLPGLKMFLNDHNTLTLSPPPSNSESYLSCYYGNCTESWAITLDQSVQGNSYGYYKIGTGTGLDISITWTHNGETKTLAEWKNTESQGGMGPGIPLAAVPGDIITLNITCRNSGTYYWWSNGKYSYITIME